MCAHAVSVAIQKLEGVESVRVSLNEGLAEVILKPGNSLDPERIRQVARDSGFTPKDAEVQARGRLIEDGDGLALAVSGLDAVYRLAEHPEAQGRLAALASETVVAQIAVTGQIPETKKESGAPRTLRLRDFSVESR